ncbi:sulfurtransferase [Nitrincola sp. A-D6]|uniref:thiosulfate sulfurtransferase GlpE n=1 Tax=Nitrincola sp. A-D6 TaxID=1545442 RepID=UPI00051F93D3|nr:thiosulfate sulfurtransferase GlpE [Nitrincola sp. A-D6]KGK42067.1 sulfurtransferase [Nitrincola sp. A-D6]
MSQFKSLAPQAAVTLLEQGAAVVDIRDLNSFNSSHIPQAQNLNNDNLPVFLQQADRNQALIVYCYHGISSQSAADFLAGQGFTEVYSLDGGFEQWKLQFPELCQS